MKRYSFLFLIMLGAIAQADTAQVKSVESAIATAETEKEKGPRVDLSVAQSRSNRFLMATAALFATGLALPPVAGFMVGYKDLQAGLLTNELAISTLGSTMQIASIFRLGIYTIVALSHKGPEEFYADPVRIAPIMIGFLRDILPWLKMKDVLTVPTLKLFGCGIGGFVATDVANMAVYTLSKLAGSALR